ncbi:DNA-binding response regulator [Parageobacillus toebii]|nr:helix-turn-helix transcriptional regulator [Parageobacillus yumthangensis]PUF87704.1 DNA-binding response regulator [Geobacillus sp. LYN3]RDV23760.1 DNA-binding response regulator [Parageobacillus toebii]TXK86229.1 response regulator transcription factor [Geobacillus sp. AYS3]
MSQTLNHHLNYLLKSAVSLLSIYYEDLSQEWQSLYCYLKQMRKKSIAMFEFLSGSLQKWLASAATQEPDIYKMLQDIQTEWWNTFQQRPDPETLIFYLNLLENSSHKVLKSRIAYSTKLHPSVHYLFFKLNETLLYQMNEQSFNMRQLQSESAYADVGRDLWKDAVILFDEWILRSQTFQESIENICFGFAHFLPFQRCALFKFVNKESVGVGLYGHHLNKAEIQSIAAKIENIPILKESLVKLKSQVHVMKNFQPIYVPFADKEFPKQYVQKFQLVSLIIVPVYVPTEGKIIGGVLLDQGPGRFFTVDRSLFPALMKFGQSAGELLLKFIEAQVSEADEQLDEVLSPREIEILKLLADGASTSEAACQLYLSEFTVRDYISSMMKKLKAKNRTEAVAKAIRMGIIS